jgi:dihydroneopterin aldolase
MARAYAIAACGGEAKGEQEGTVSEDVLRLKNMRFYAYHGLFPEEEKLGQRFEVDVDIHGDFQGYARGETRGAVDYPLVYTTVQEVVTQERYGLVESVADRIAEVLQERFGIERLVVRVRKPHPPVPGDFDGIEVEVRRGV